MGSCRASRGLSNQHRPLLRFLYTRVPENLPVQFLVANVTPFDARANLDTGRLRAHIEWLVESGVHGFVPSGSNGELLYLSAEERAEVHRVVLDAAPGSTVIPCVWDPSPATVHRLVAAAANHGARSVLVPPPLYYPVEDEVLAGWFRDVAAASPVPVLAYHNPTYFPTDISEAMYLRLRNDGVLTGLKDSSRDVARLERLAAADPGTVYAGGGAVLPHVHRIEGLAGFISALGNAWPRLCLRSFSGDEAAREGVLSRGSAVSAAGGFRAMKAVLGIGCRAPFPAPSPAYMADVPPAER